MGITETMNANALSFDLPSSLGRTELWRKLTREWSHFSAYASEPYLRESIADADAVLGEYLQGFTHRYAALLIKPDAMVGRRATLICDHLRNNSFRIVRAIPFQFDRLMVRELWRYSMNISTNAKFALVDSIHAASQSIYLLLEDQEPAPAAASATVRLQHLKGSAFENQRSQASIRSVAGSPNEMLVLVHTPDEPLEMLREIGLLFDHESRITLFESSLRMLEENRSQTQEEIASIITRIESSVPFHELDTGISTERMQIYLDAQSEKLSPNEIWERIKRTYWSSKDPTALWDSIMVGTSVIDLSIEGMQKLIE